MAIDSFELKAANQTLCNGSIDTTIDTSKISVQEMDASKKVYDLATMTEDDLQTFGEESQKLMDAWVERLSDNTAFVNLINALNSLFGTNSDLLNQVEEDIDEDTATYSDADFSDDNTDEITLDNASVMTYEEVQNTRSRDVSMDLTSSMRMSMVLCLRQSRYLRYSMGYILQNLHPTHWILSIMICPTSTATRFWIHS